MCCTSGKAGTSAAANAVACITPIVSASAMPRNTAGREAAKGEAGWRMAIAPCSFTARRWRWSPWHHLPVFGVAGVAACAQGMGKRLVDLL